MKLKPCPFCGSEAMLNCCHSTSKQQLVYYIDCTNAYCAVMTKVFYDEEGVINAWNRRAE